MKKFKISLLSMVLSIIMVTMNISAVFAYSNGAIQTNKQTTNISKYAPTIGVNTNEGIINEINKALTINSNGIVIDKTEMKAVLKDIDFKDLKSKSKVAGDIFTEDLTADKLNKYITENITKLNEEISSGKLTILENGALIDSSDDNFYVQGGSTYKQNYWWGVRQYKSTYYAGLWAGKLNQSAINFGGVATGAALLGFLPQAGVSAFGAWYMSSVANSVNTINNSTSRGIVADIHIWLYYTVKSQ